MDLTYLYKPIESINIDNRWKKIIINYGLITIEKNK